MAIIITMSFFILIWAYPVNASWLSKAAQNISKESKNCISGGCDLITEANRRFDDGVRSKGRAMAKGVREEFEKSMDRLFNEQIKPLVESLDTLIKSGVKDIDNLVQKAFDRADQIIDQAVSKFENATERTIERVKEKIIITASDELYKHRKNLISDINVLVNMIDCSIVGNIKRVDIFFDEKIEKIPIGWPSWLTSRDKCQKELNLGKDISEYRISQRYDLTACRYFKGITEYTSIEYLWRLYGDLQDLAAQYRCLTRQSPEAAELYTREWLRFGKSAALWKVILFAQ